MLCKLKKLNQSLNVELTDQISCILKVLYPPVLTSLSILFNGISFYIYTRKCFIKTSSGFYFSILAVVETLAVIFGSLKFFLQEAFNVTIVSQSILSCKLLQTIIYLLCQFASWILVVISLDRLFLIKYPHKFIGSKAKCRRIRKLIIILLFGLITLINAPNFAFLTLIKKNSKFECDLEVNFLGYNKFVLNALDLLFTCIIPFACLTISGSLVSMLIIKSKQKISVSRMKSMKSYTFFTKNILARNMFFLLLNLPLCVTIFFIANDEEAKESLKQSLVDLLFTLANMFCYVNFSFAFFVHMKYNKLFRKIFFSILRKRILVFKHPASGLTICIKI